MRKKKYNKKMINNFGNNFDNYFDNYETRIYKDFENHYYREISTPIMKIRYDKMRDMIYVFD